MICKYDLTISGVTHELPNSCIKNWDEIKYTLKRSELGGVVRTFTSKFMFADEAYDLLLNEYIDKYLASYAQITINTITDRHTYSELFTCQLDFGSFSHDGYIVSISSVDDSIPNIIKAKKGTQYEYIVSGIAAKCQLYYDRMNMQNLFHFTIGDSYVLNPLEAGDVYVSSYNNEVSRGGYIEYDNGEKGIVATLIDVPKSGINVSVDMNVEYEDSGDGQYITLTLSSCGNTRNVVINKGESKNVKLDVSVSKSSFDSFSGRKIIYISIELKATHTTHAKFNIKKINEFKVTYLSIGDPVYIDVINPNAVLNSLLKSMNGGKDGIIGEIVSGVDARLDNCLIVTAESIRGIKDAKLYSSYTKFVSWMEAVFGFVPVINGNIVRFVHRDSLFGSDVAKHLHINHSNFEYSVDDSLIYSSVSVGYDKQDYDSINGRDEFHFTTEFTTGVNITNNKLELISPYRADPYGIEFLAQKRGKNTTDSESDNDVFFVGAKLNDNESSYILIRDAASISGVLSPETMFNVMYWQRSMLLANQKYIGMFTDILEFASSDGNSDVTVNSIKLSEVFFIHGRIATCGRISIETFDEDVPSIMDGVIMLTKGDFSYRGYMNELDYGIGQFGGVKYELMVQSVSKSV